LLNYKVPLIFFVGLMVPFVSVFLISRFVLRYSQQAATLKAGLLAFPDMVFFGIPIFHSLFGPASLYVILIANLIPSLFIIPLTTLLMDLGSKKSNGNGADALLRSWRHAIRQPMVSFPIVGALLVILNLHVPNAVISSLDLIGAGTTGLSLFVVGLIIAEQKVELSRAVAIDVIFKNLIHPAAMVVTVLAFGVHGILAREAILLMAIPSAVITTMFAQEYGVLVTESSTAVLATRVLSFATIPAVIALTRYWR
jgi:predicted permease